MTTHYETLGVSPQATADEIKAAWRRIAARRHPDHGGDNSEFIAARAAFDILIDPEKREQYDLGGIVIDLKNVDAEAIDIIGRMFTSYLDSEDEYFDPAQTLRMSVMEHSRGIDAQLKKAERAFERARRRRRSMRKRGGASAGHDLFAAVAKQKMMGAYAEVQRMKRAQAVIKRAYELALEYENGPPPEPPAKKQQQPLRLTLHHSDGGTEFIEL